MSINKKKVNKKRNSSTKLDIIGKICPMTFVYTKLALEKITSGSILEVFLDYPPAVENIPDNCIRQGIAKVMSVEEEIKGNNLKIWKIILEKT